MRYLVFILSLFIFSCKSDAKKDFQQVINPESSVETISSNNFTSKISILSKDGLPIVADVYEMEGNKPTILLCHQAGYSRGEYLETAEKLLQLGFSSMAIDQRSGKGVNDVENETFLEAQKRGLATTYLDARQDIEAAIDYLYEYNGNQPVILVGSSYSATLSLLIGKDSEKVKAIIAFSPGEYFDGIDVKKNIASIAKPTYVTSSKKEAEALTEMVSLVNAKYLMHYTPEVKGIHGSRALWSSVEGHQEYWQSLEDFYNRFFAD